MKSIDSPGSLAAMLIELFPPFAAELEGVEITGHHQIITRLTPLITGYLQDASKRTTEKFCEVVSAMVSAGGEKENAISTCLLEHASQVSLRKIILLYLTAAAKKELR